MEPLLKSEGQLKRLAVLAEGDGLAEVVHHHLARIAPRHVLLELGAEGGIHRAVHVVVEQREPILASQDGAFHTGSEPFEGRRLHGSATSTRASGLASSGWERRKQRA